MEGGDEKRDLGFSIVDLFSFNVAVRLHALPASTPLFCFTSGLGESVCIINPSFLGGERGAL